MPQTISKEYKKPLKAPYSYTVVQEQYQCSFQQFTQARTMDIKFYTDNKYLTGWARDLIWPHSVKL